jgi:hypothetical protein
MPIITEPNGKRRRTGLLALLAIPGVILLLLAGLVAWSWGQPVHLDIGAGTIRFGRTPVWQDFHFAPGFFPQSAQSGYVAVDVPGTLDVPYGSPYVIAWDWRYRLRW